MNEQKKCQELLVLFEGLRKILLEENENNWVRGINSICHSLSSCVKFHGDFNGSINYVRETYKYMMGGNGSFSDFYIWRDNFNERVLENNKLDKIKDEIWKRLTE
ncbi:hypothetical protein UCD39_26375 [Nitrospirillum sp. BR 11752]|uniref:hypothetical protein n=1 Tax=Nitrospirillum sp. BR 11752 TaxID=3104293 RepID=UPI002EACD8FA|nr:hypothetical protein [Nitrospirillum sp. BR 11752]